MHRLMAIIYDIVLFMNIQHFIAMTRNQKLQKIMAVYEKRLRTAGLNSCISSSIQITTGIV